MSMSMSMSRPMSRPRPNRLLHLHPHSHSHLQCPFSIVHLHSLTPLLRRAQNAGSRTPTRRLTPRESGTVLTGGPLLSLTMTLTGRRPSIRRQTGKPSFGAVGTSASCAAFFVTTAGQGGHRASGQESSAADGDGKANVSNSNSGSSTDGKGDEDTAQNQPRGNPPPKKTRQQINKKKNARRRPSSSSSSSLSPPRPPPPFPTVTTCPTPTCPCASAPPPLEGLPVDAESPLNGVMAAYAEQVLVCTGRDDWPSRIEEEDGGDNLAADLKELFGRGGVYSDPFHNISVLNSSFPSSKPRPPNPLLTTSAYLLPSFKYVPFLPRISFDSVKALAEGYLLPEKLHPVHEGLSPVHRDRLTRKEAYRSLLYGVRDVEDVLVLICGHGGRDMRCGVAGPVLRREFEEKLPGLGVGLLTGAVDVDGDDGVKKGVAAARRIQEGSSAAADEVSVDAGTSSSSSTGAVSVSSSGAQSSGMRARVGLISHIGGHKFAGNVIVYIPPLTRIGGNGETALHPLAGMGIWYGRVEPRHVEGIIRETILGGRVIADMFRGGIDRERKILRM